MKEDEQGKERRCVLFQVRRQRQQVQTKYWYLSTKLHGVSS
jgi:hypothetical protein